MNISSTNLWLSFALVLSLGLNWRLPHDSARPNADTILPNMAHSPANKYFAPMEALPLGQTLQTAPVGTQALGVEPFPYGASLEERTRAGSELYSTLDINDPAVIERGKLMYERNCSHCHGMGGNADGPVVQRGYPAPKSLVQGELLALREGEIFHVITMGFKNMPSQAYQVPAEDRWKIIAYIHTLQAAAAAAPADTVSQGAPQ